MNLNTPHSLTAPNGLYVTKTEEINANRLLALFLGEHEILTRCQPNANTF